MYWGAGPELGLLTLAGYLAFVTGAAMVWRKRSNAVVLVYDEVSALRQLFSRYELVGPFYMVRGESRLKAVPSNFRRSVRRWFRAGMHRPAILLSLGMLMFVLDFFI
ncbi:MAG TPA: hypothetical protein VFA13_06685 [Candidatus Acidoferrum sp.]|jgi:hypothetical protein|nr:hypothetical protein [Candidatus Acidoferrum sp.]